MFSCKTKTNGTRGTESFGNQPQKYNYDVIYLMEPLTASEVMIIVTTKQGVDAVFRRSGCIVFFQTDSQSNSKPFGAYCCIARLSKYDYS